jgi:predicted esterase YcpF (UPF0227 family)
MEVVANGVLAPEETGPYSEQDLQALQESEQQEQQEELIGGKFKSADDLLQAYQELEKKLGSRSGYERADEQLEEDSVEEDQAADVAVLSQEEEATIMESIGGKEAFSAVQEWARANLDQAELDAYNREVNSGDYYRARNALQSLQYAYQDNVGSEPDLIGGKLSGNSADVFRSTQEVMAAMNDPRYLNDTAYTQDVQEKLYRSDVLGPTG